MLEKKTNNKSYATVTLCLTWGNNEEIEGEAGQPGGQQLTQHGEMVVALPTW